jgi:hypothetical protein
MSDTPVSKEEFFKSKFLGLVREIADPATADPQSMIAVGALARRIMDDAKVMGWGAFKRGLTRELYDATLRTFEKQGNTLVRDKKLRTAYAIQVLAMSLIARTQSDPEVAAFDQKLDGIIDLAASHPGQTGGPAN